MMMWFLGLSTALWLGITALAYYCGQQAGHAKGYQLAQTRDADRRALMIANAKLAGRYEVWQEVSDMLAEFAEPIHRHSGTVN